MGLYGAFKTSPKLETEGIRLDFPGARIMVARAGGANQAYNKAMKRIAAKHRQALENRTLDDDLALKSLRRAYAETVVVDWQTEKDGEWVDGIEDENGNIVPATADAIEAIFIAIPDLFMQVKTEAENFSNFLASNLEETIKN